MKNLIPTFKCEMQVLSYGCESFAQFGCGPIPVSIEEAEFEEMDNLIERQNDETELKIEKENTLRDFFKSKTDKARLRKEKSVIISRSMGINKTFKTMRQKSIQYSLKNPLIHLNYRTNNKYFYDTQNKPTRN